MDEIINLPRSALTPELWRNGNLGRLYLYLLTKADENGIAAVDSGEVFRALGLARQTYRTLLGKLLANHLLTTLPTTNLTTVKFDIQQVKPKRQPSKQPPKQPPANHLNIAVDDYVDPLFADAWKLWIDYRREINNNYKTEQSKRIGYEQFLKKSNNDPCKAMEMVKNTIANGYKGLFPERNNEPRRSTPANTAVARQESRGRLRTLAAEIVSRSENLVNLYNGGGTDPDTREN